MVHGVRDSLECGHDQVGHLGIEIRRGHDQNACQSGQNNEERDRSPPWRPGLIQEATRTHSEHQTDHRHQSADRKKILPHTMTQRPSGHPGVVFAP